MLSAVARDFVYGDTAKIEVRRSVSTWTPVGAGGAFVAAGAIGRATSNQACSANAADNGSFKAVDAIQYLPLAFPWVMKIAGAETRSGWGQMAVSQGLGAALMAGTVYSLKYNIDAPRPDGSNNRSFPSGHTAWAFLGATAVSRELGHRSPWYTIGAYAAATGVGVSRVVDRRHFPTDVIAGAGIGVVAGHLGYYIGDLIFGNKSEYLSVENLNRSSLSISTGMAIPLNKPEGISIAPALTTSVQGSIAIGNKWGAKVSVEGLSTPIQKINQNITGIINSIGMHIGGYYRIPLSSFFDISVGLSAGEYYNQEVYGDSDVFEVNKWVTAGRGSVSAGLRMNENTKCHAIVGYQIAGNRLVGTSTGISSTLHFAISTAIQF